MVNGLPSKQLIWVQVPLPVKMFSKSLKYFNEIKQHFLKQGKKSRMEKLFKIFLLKRAKNAKQNFSNTVQKCMINATPYIRLKMRRRGKRTKYKIAILNKIKREKKSLAVIKQSIGKPSSQNFLEVFEKEFEKLAIGNSIGTQKRNELHRLAFKIVPKRKLKKKVIKLVTKKLN